MDFLSSVYYQSYQSFLNNRSLIDFLEQNGLKLVFYPHHEMRPFIGSFSTKSSLVEIVKADEQYDIQNLLKEAALLVTDYSSVHFDFAYMCKPVIYYQFDYEMFTAQQYEKGFFDFRVHGFGPVVGSEDKLIRKLVILICRMNICIRFQHFFQCGTDTTATAYTKEL